ncbi:MAG: acyl-CoA thioesterase [Kiritimatiellae bacterium]|nr:acyl-CoA thioesterase [Kiritimatiellia bacterium]
MTISVYQKRFAFPPSARDLNEHVNNIEYVRLMQDVANEHVEANGWPMEKLLAEGWSWVVRTHHIDYKRPCLPGEPISLYTWVQDFQRIHSRRCYRFVRETDGAVLAEAMTDWVSVDIHTHRPVATPPVFIADFPPTPEAEAAGFGREWRQQA